MSKVTIVLMRHGQTVFNVERKVQGWSDSFLTQEGKEMVCKRARELKKEYTFDAIYSSDSSRAIQTARLMAVEYGMNPEDVKLHSGMREYCYGPFEGGPDRKMYRAIMWKALWNSSYLKKMKSNDISYFFDCLSEINSKKQNPYFSENYLDFKNRLLLALRTIAIEAIENEKQCVLVLTHGHALTTLFASLANKEYNEAFTHIPVLENCAVLALEYDSDYDTYSVIQFINTKV